MYEVLQGFMKHPRQSDWSWNKNGLVGGTKQLRIQVKSKAGDTQGRKWVHINYLQRDIL